VKDLKIFSDSYKLIIEILNETSHFPKYLRPTLARRIEELSLDLVQSIRRATFLGARSQQRRDLLLKISDDLDDLRVLLDISRDLKVLSLQKSEKIAEITQEIGKEIGGLIKYSERKT
jgi:hypothetical protein